MNKLEKSLISFAFVLILLSIYLPAIKQPPAYLDFADQRTFNILGLTINNTLDLLTNLPYIFAGLIGLFFYHFILKNVSLANLSAIKKLTLLTTFWGFIFTGLGSGYFHLNISNETLFWDRMGMVIVFAGFVGLVICEKVGDSAGLFALIFTLIFAGVTNYYWLVSGNIMPWSVAQGGGMVLLLILTFLQNRPTSLKVNFLVIIILYTIAKLLELLDKEVYTLTTTLISGHSLKHIVSSLAVFPVLLALNNLNIKLK